jgi:hypothetical protein
LLLRDISDLRIIPRTSASCGGLSYDRRYFLQAETRRTDCFHEIAVINYEYQL